MVRHKAITSCELGTHNTHHDTYFHSTNKIVFCFFFAIVNHFDMKFQRINRCDVFCKSNSNQNEMNKPPHSGNKNRTPSNKLSDYQIVSRRRPTKNQYSKKSRESRSVFGAHTTHTHKTHIIDTNSNFSWFYAK